MAKSQKQTVATPELSGVVTVIGVRAPYLKNVEYEMAAEHAKIIIEKQLVKLK